MLSVLQHIKDGLTATQVVSLFLSHGIPLNNKYKMQNLFLSIDNCIDNVRDMTHKRIYMTILSATLKDLKRDALLDLVSYLLTKIRLKRDGWDLFNQLLDRIDPHVISSKTIYLKKFEELGTFEVSVTWDAILTALEVSKISPENNMYIVGTLTKVFSIFSKDQLSMRTKEHNPQSENSPTTKILPLSLLFSMNEEKLQEFKKDLLMPSYRPSIVSCSYFYSFRLFENISLQYEFWKKVSTALIKSKHHISSQTKEGNIFTDNVSTMKLIKSLVTGASLEEYENLNDKINIKIDLKDEDKNCILESEEKIISQRGTNKILKKSGIRSSSYKRISTPVEAWQWATVYDTNWIDPLFNLKPFESNNHVGINTPIEKKWEFLSDSWVSLGNFEVLVNLKEKSCDNKNLHESEIKFIKIYIEKNINIPDFPQEELQVQIKSSFKRFACDDIVFPSLTKWRRNSFGIINIKKTKMELEEKANTFSNICYVHGHNDILEYKAKRKMLAEWLLCAIESGTDQDLIEYLKDLKEQNVFSIEDHKTNIRTCEI